MEDECREDVANERARALWAETQVEQERCGCAHAIAFLSVPDAIPRLISLMVVLEPYRALKSRILTRNGQQWALAAMVAVVPVAASDGSVPSPAVPLAASSAEPQKMIIKEACQGDELKDVMVACWPLLVDVGSPMWCLFGVPGVSRDASLRRWAMIARAGAGAHLVFVEMQRYPWRLFFLFGYDCDAGARVFASEAQSCRHQCFLGELARLHWKRYPSVQALLSGAALAEINSMALLLTDNTALLEAEHAGGKRSARSREDTHLEHVMDSSGLRLVKQLVADGKQWHQDVLAAEDARKDPPKQGNAVSLAVDRRRARPGKQNARSQVSSTSKKKKTTKA